MSQGNQTRPPAAAPAPAAAKAPAALPGPAAPLSDRMAGVRGEREAAGEQIQRTMKVWRQADGGADPSSLKIFRAAGDPKNVAELVGKLTGKALEAHTQMTELEQGQAINGICAGSKVKQADGTLSVPGAQAAFEARWMDAANFASRKLLKDQAFKKKLDDALSSIKNSCDETDGKNRPNATLGDGTSETALSWEAANGKPWISQDGHYQKVPNYSTTIATAVALLETEKGKITDATKVAEIDAAITRGKDRVAKMAPSIATWGNRIALYPAKWKPDGDSKVQPGFPKVK